MFRRPSLAEDVRSFALIAGSAVVGAVAIHAFSADRSSKSPAVNHPAAAVAATESPAVVGFPASRYELVEPMSGANRLYGTVRTNWGAVHEGFLRWDRNEGSWGDQLDARKTGRWPSLSGIRFGHLQSIQPTGSFSADLTLRSGQTVSLQGQATDLGGGFRGLVVTPPADGQTSRSNVTLDWREIASVEFALAPAGSAAPGSRLHGTLVTRSGLEFTGYVVWDVSEIHSRDYLEGKASGDLYKVPFGAIRSIRRASPRMADLALHSGQSFRLSSTADVSSKNTGITVSDPGLGQVKLGWEEFESVRFHAAETEQSFADFDGGRPLRGTVVTASGDEVAGLVRWDLDESRSWELLNGQTGGVEFSIEFSKIAAITKNQDSEGSVVTLRDGRAFHLRGANDVGRGNRGIVVESGGRSYEVKWSDFAEFRLEH